MERSDCDDGAVEEECEVVPREECGDPFEQCEDVCEKSYKCNTCQ